MDAIALVAHHDDHVLFMGGAIQRMVSLGWRFHLLTFCTPYSERRNYFLSCCEAWGVQGTGLEFRDHYYGDPYSSNAEQAMRDAMLAATGGKKYDLVFTHSRAANGEYLNGHLNHVEVQRLVTRSVQEGLLAHDPANIVYFAYQNVYGDGLPTCAAPDATHLLGLSYEEQLAKLTLTIKAPDSATNLKNLRFPCPNPEGYDSTSQALPDCFRKV